LRHGYAAHAISSGVPAQVLSRSTGNADREMTALYAQTFGIVEQSIAVRMWE
jgi:hypothetical protein